MFSQEHKSRLFSLTFFLLNLCIFSKTHEFVGCSLFCDTTNLPKKLVFSYPKILWSHSLLFLFPFPKIWFFNQILGKFLKPNFVPLPFPFPKNFVFWDVSVNTQFWDVSVSTSLSQNLVSKTTSLLFPKKLRGVFPKKLVFLGRVNTEFWQGNKIGFFKPNFGTNFVVPKFGLKTKFWEREWDQQVFLGRHHEVGPKIWLKNFPKIWFKNQILGKGKGNKRDVVSKTKFWVTKKTSFFGRRVVPQKREKKSRKFFELKKDSFLKKVDVFFKNHEFL
jgi:hypothetical protein